MNALTRQAEGGALAPATSTSGFTGISMMNPEKFDHMVRVGRMLGMSPLVPKHLREGGPDAATANGVLVLNMAERLGEDPLTVAQNIYFVNGSPGWNATYMISKANQHGVFKDPIDWDVKGKGDGLIVTAMAVLSSTGKKVEISTSMEMAKAENWTRNSKYKSMPEQMLRYRSATMLIRLYCPEVMVGVPSVVELDDSNFRDVTPKTDSDAGASSIMDAIPAEEEAPKKPRRKSVDRTPPKPAVIEDEPEPEQEAVAEEGPADKGQPVEVVDEETGEVTTKPSKDDADPKHARMAAAIKKDMDNGGIDAALNFYADNIRAMEREAPEVYADLMEYADKATETDA